MTRSGTTRSAAAVRAGKIVPEGAGVRSDSDKIAMLMKVLEVSRRLGATIDLEELLGFIEQAALAVLDCERATVFLWDRKTDELYSRLATGVGELRIPVNRGIAGEVARTGSVVNVPDAYRDPRFNPEIDRKTGFVTRNILSFPLIGHDQLTVGVLQVLNKRSGGFDDWDETLVRTFGAQVGVALQRQLLLEQFAEKQRIEHDLGIARNIQQALIPEAPPDAAGFDIAGWNKPADETGGDCYDFLTLDRGEIAVTIADATGHGIGPALVIAECRALLRACASLTDSLPRIVKLVNNLLCNDLPDNRFVTAFFGLLRPAESRLSFVSAGHGPIVFFNAEHGTFESLPINGVPFGILEGVEYDDPIEVAFRAGDMLLLFTDGFFEATNAQREQFGMNRVQQIIAAQRSATASELIERIYAEVVAFSGGAPQADDLTAVIIRKL